MMINLISFIAIFIVNSLMKYNAAYPEMINSFLSITLVFSVFANFFIMILKNKVSSIKKRYSFICILYIVMIIDCILAIFYFSYYLMDIKPFKLFCQIFIYSTYFMAIILLKRYEFKQSRNYDFNRSRKISVKAIQNKKTYTKFIIAETTILVILSILDIVETTATMILYPWTINLIIALFGLLAIINLLRRWFEPYWYHKKILFIRLIKLMNEHALDKAVIPPQREIENDAILKEVKYVLDMSFIRPLEVNRLVKQLYDIMISIGYKKNIAVNYSTMWKQTLTCNLMRRKNDWKYIPCFLSKYLTKNRYKGNNKRKNF